MSTFVKTLLILFVSIFTLSASDITQFGPSNVVYDAAEQEDTLWLATYAGLVQYSLPEKRAIRTEHSNANMRDIKLQALYFEPDGTLWAGSAKGYFYKKTKRGSWTTFEDFVASNSGINQVVPYGDSHLLVAHNTGVSIFDLKKERVISTATDFADVEGGKAYQLKVVDDTLFVGVNQSIVRFDSLSTRIFKIDFRNSKKWQTEKTEEFLVKGLTYDGTSIRGFEMAAALINGVTYYGKSYKEKADKDYNIAYFFRETTSGIDSVRIGGTFENIKKEGTISAGGNISSIRSLSSGSIIVTTTRDYFSMDPFSHGENGELEFFVDTIPGFVHGSYQKGMISAAGDLWLNSTLDPGDQNPEWWKGVNRFDGKNNYHYNCATPGFGVLSGWLVFQGLSDSREGKIWFGSSADNIKMWAPSDNSWNHYIIYDYWDRDDSLYIKKVDDAFAGRFKKVDGICQDSMGYMWFSSWQGSEKGSGSRHRFGVLNPNTEEYGFVFHRQKGIVGLDASKAYHAYITAVDSRGARFFIDPTLKDYIMVAADLDPIKDSAAMEVVNSGFFYRKIPDGAVVQEAVASKSGSVLLATDLGLQLLRSDVHTVKPIEDDRDTSIQNDHYRKKFGSVAIEESKVERNASRLDSTGQTTIVYDSIVTTIFWASVNEVGVERFTLTERIKDSVVEPVVILSENPILIPEEKKYYFTSPGQVMIDHKRHELWFAHTEGLIRYKLGFNPTTEFSDNSESKIYPNPYSKSRHNRITIDHLSPNVYIDIYSISGKLLAHFDQNNNKIFESVGRGKIFRWEPSDEWAPGTYLIAIKDSEEKLTEIRKFLIIP